MQWRINHNKIEGKISKHNGIIIGFENSTENKDGLIDAGKDFFFDKKTKIPLDGHHTIVPSLYTKDDYEEWIYIQEEFFDPYNDPDNRTYIDIDGEFVEASYRSIPLSQSNPYEVWKKENIDFLEKYPHEVTFKDGYKHGLEIYYGFQIEYGQGPLYDKGELDDHSPKRDIPHRDEITWSNGRIHGLFRKYDYEGNLWIEEIYEEGFIKQYNYYNDNLGWRTAPPNGNLV
jgi:hypothetical protein